MLTSEGLLLHPYAQDNGGEIRSLQTGHAKKYCTQRIVP